MSECEYCGKKIKSDENYCKKCMKDMDFHICENCGEECDNCANYCQMCGHTQ